jgi:hypothetical protein
MNNSALFLTVHLHTRKTAVPGARQLRFKLNRGKMGIIALLSSIYVRKFFYLTWHHLSCAAVGHLVDQAGLHQRLAYARDLGAAKLDERRSHDGARQPAQ